MDGSLNNKDLHYSKVKKIIQDYAVDSDFNGHRLGIKDNEGWYVYEGVEKKRFHHLADDFNRLSRGTTIYNTLQFFNILLEKKGEYKDIVAMTLFLDCDLKDDVKKTVKENKGERTDDLHVIGKKVISFVCNAFNKLVSPESIELYDSGGGFYCEINHRVTYFISQLDILDEDKGLIWKELCQRFDKVFLKSVENKIRESINKYDEYFKFDYLNNNNRQVKSPLSVHKSMPVYVHPIDPNNIDFEEEYIPINDSKLVIYSKKINNRPTWQAAKEDCQKLVSILWKEYSGEWEEKLKKWVEDKKKQEKEKEEHRQEVIQRLKEKHKEIEKLETTSNIQDIFDAVSTISMYEVVEMLFPTTIRPNGDIRFTPTWRSSDSGTSCFICNDYTIHDLKEKTTMNVIQLIGAHLEIVPLGETPTGENYWKCIDELRSLGFKIPEFKLPKKKNKKINSNTKTENNKTVINKGAKQDQQLGLCSTQKVWREFFETYYWDSLNKLAEEISQCTDTNVNNGNGYSAKGKSLVVDVKKDLLIFQEMKVWEELRIYPDTVIEKAKQGLTEAENIHNITVTGNIRLSNLPETSRIQLKHLSQFLNTFVSMEGVVNNVTYKNPFIITGAWQCTGCGKVITKPVQEDNPFCEIYPPYECRGCGSRRFVLDEINSETVDAQLITIQEYPENLNRGEEPRMVKVFAREDITGMVYPGDRVIINGIPRIRAITNKKDRRAFRDLYVFANYIEVYESEYEEISISQKEREQIIELSQDPNMENKIVSTIAPSIYGYEVIKKAIALQLFGGKEKTLPDGTYKRGDIHMLLVGDPGTGKSIISRWVKNVAPRAVLTTGKGTTGAGLTASAEKTEDGRWTIKAGALVLADKGIAIVDELDKMRKEELSFFNEALEQHTISIAKAGISTTLKSRISLLAVANPQKERFDPDTNNNTVADQIGMTPTLLERFDLIFKILNRPEEERDSEISRKIIEEEDTSEMDEDKLKRYSGINNDLLRKYIAYAKRNIHPKLTREAKDRIHSYYMSVRGVGGIDSPVPISERQLQSILRLTEAAARMRLSQRAEKRDADTAIEVLSICLRETGRDPETGELDIDMVQGSSSKRRRDKASIVEDIIEEGTETYTEGLSKDYILEQAQERGVNKKDTRNIIKKLAERGDIYEPTNNWFRMTDD